MRLVFALLPVILPLVVADTHDMCACHSQKTRDSPLKYDWELTMNNCQENFPHMAPYDHGYGNCVAYPRYQIDGDRFQNDCYQLGVVDGFHPIDKKSGYMDGDKRVKVYFAKGQCHKLPKG